MSSNSSSSTYSAPTSPSISDCTTASSLNFSELAEALEMMKANAEILAGGDLATGAAVRPGPPSYYHVQEMNKAPPVVAPTRLSRVPSQYQLESLTEVYVFDIPQLTVAHSPLVHHHYHHDHYHQQQLQQEANLETGPQQHTMPVYRTSEYVLN